MSLSLLGWRRTVTATYAEVRADPDPRRAWLDWRRARDELFASHPNSPIPVGHRASFTGLRYADYDPGLRFELPVEPAESARIEVLTATDGVVPFERFGRVTLPDLGGLDVWWLDSYGGGVFVPVKDPNPDTYGGGRYLIDTVKGADLGGHHDRRDAASDGRRASPGRAAGGWLVIDLNFAYNPSCAYDSYWSCPLAPPGNVLDAPLHAGELCYVRRQGSS